MFESLRCIAGTCPLLFLHFFLEDLGKKNWGVWDTWMPPRASVSLSLLSLGFKSPLPCSFYWSWGQFNSSQKSSTKSKTRTFWSKLEWIITWWHWHDTHTHKQQASTSQRKSHWRLQRWWTSNFRAMWLWNKTPQQFPNLQTFRLVGYGWFIGCPILDTVKGSRGV